MRDVLLMRYFLNWLYGMITQEGRSNHSAHVFPIMPLCPNNATDIPRTGIERRAIYTIVAIHNSRS